MEKQRTEKPTEQDLAPVRGHAPIFAAFCEELTLEERIAIVKAYRPHWTVRQIADACGVSTRTILRSDSYRRLEGIDKAQVPAQRYRNRIDVSTSLDTAVAEFAKEDDKEESYLTDVDGVADEVAKAEIFERVRAAVAELSEDDRRLIQLHYMDSLSTSETAKLLGISMRSAYHKLSKLRIKLSNALSSNQRGLEEPPVSRTDRAKGPCGRETEVRSEGYVYLLRGNDSTGRKAWYYVLVDESEKSRFEMDARKGTIQLGEHGKVLSSGYGDDPPAHTKGMMKYIYVFDDGTFINNENISGHSERIIPERLREFSSGELGSPAHLDFNERNVCIENIASLIRLPYGIPIVSEGPPKPTPPDASKLEAKTPVAAWSKHLANAIATMPKEDAPYAELAQAGGEITHEVRRRLAGHIALALNEKIRAMPQETLEEKKELGRWVNDQLEPLGLAVQDPRTGRPGKLRGTRGSWPGVGCFQIEVVIDGKQEVPTVSNSLPTLQLMDADPPEEVRSHFRELVKKKINRTFPAR